MTPTERLFDVYEPRTAFAIRLSREGRPSEDAKAAARKITGGFDEIYEKEARPADVRIHGLMAELWAAKCYAEAAEAAYQREASYLAEVICAVKNGKPIPERPCAESTNLS